MDTWAACVDPITSPFNDTPEVMYCEDKANNAINSFTSYTDMVNHMSNCLYMLAMGVSGSGDM